MIQNIIRFFQENIKSILQRDLSIEVYSFAQIYAVYPFSLISIKEINTKNFLPESYEVKFDISLISNKEKDLSVLLDNTLSVMNNDVICRSANDFFKLEKVENKVCDVINMDCNSVKWHVGSDLISYKIRLEYVCNIVIFNEISESMLIEA